MPTSDDTAKAAMAQRGFDATRVWIFDLDNTLYPAECNLFAQVDRRMGEFIARYLGVPYEYARHLQKSYYRQFGTTLAGLMRVHKIEPGPFLRRELRQSRGGKIRRSHRLRKRVLRAPVRHPRRHPQQPHQKQSFHLRNVGDLAPRPQRHFRPCQRPAPGLTCPNLTRNRPLAWPAKSHRSSIPRASRSISKARSAPRL